MERYRQKFPKLITMEDWLAKAHPDAPPLPWRGDQGEEICSFAVLPLNETGGMLVALYDAHGREVVRSADPRPIWTTCLALNTVPMELTFLPAAAPLAPSS